MCTCPFYRNHHFMIDEFIHIVSGKTTHRVIVYVFISYVFESFFNLEITDSIAHFLFINQTSDLRLPLLLFVSLVLCSLLRQIQEPFLSFFSNFRCSKLVNVRSMFYCFINQIFSNFRAQCFWSSAYSPFK